MGGSSCQARRRPLLVLCHQSPRLSSVSQKQPSLAKRQKTDVTSICYLQVCCQSHFGSAGLQGFTGHVSSLEGELLLECLQGFWSQDAPRRAALHLSTSWQGSGSRMLQGKHFSHGFMRFPLYYHGLAGWGRVLLDVLSHAQRTHTVSASQSS